MKLLITGAAGYIGGSVAAALLKQGHEVEGLVRSEARAAAVEARGITPLIGTLDDADLLGEAACRADAVVDAANAEHAGSVEALIAGLAGGGKALIHTSGSSIVGDLAGGEATDRVVDEDTAFDPPPGRVHRVEIDQRVRTAADHGIRSIVIAPSLIYGAGRGVNPHSIQIPWLIALARKAGVPRHIGPGENIWSHVHIDDLVSLYLLALEKAPAGAFYFAEAGEASIRDTCLMIARMLGLPEHTEAMTLAEASAEWGEGAAAYTMGSNSRVRAARARRELGWVPEGPSLADEIERGCYAGAACRPGG